MSEIKVTKPVRHARIDKLLVDWKTEDEFGTMCEMNDGRYRSECGVAVEYDIDNMPSLPGVTWSFWSVADLGPDEVIHVVHGSKENEQDCQVGSQHDMNVVEAKALMLLLNEMFKNNEESATVIELVKPSGDAGRDTQ